MQQPPLQLLGRVYPDPLSPHLVRSNRYLPTPPPVILNRNLELAHRPVRGLLGLLDRYPDVPMGVHVPHGPAERGRQQPEPARAEPLLHEPDVPGEVGLGEPLGLGHAALGWAGQGSRSPTFTELFGIASGATVSVGSSAATWAYR